MSKKYAYTKDQVLASLCRDSFFDFMKTFWHVIITETPVWNWHIEYLCQELQEVAERVFRNEPRKHDLVINIAPGTSKSSIISVMYPAWVWTRQAHRRFITASYAHTLAIDLARKSRDVIKSELYRKLFPEVHIREDSDTKAHFLNTEGGDRFSVGVNGAVMGLHGHFIIVDDPLDPSQALSEIELRNADKWMRHVIPSRKLDKAVSVTILVMQRLHQTDPSGMLLEEAEKSGAVKIKHICLPARLPDMDHNNVHPIELRDRYIGGLMDPVRMPEENLREFETRSAYAFAGQFMQSPSPIGGGLFKDEYFLQRVKAAPFNAKRIRYWDRACLVPGTMIETSRGEVRIEDVQVGDLVWTRKGYRRVIRAWLTKYTDDIVTLRLPNGRSLSGTSDHLVWTEENAWQELATTTSGCYTLLDTNFRGVRCTSESSGSKSNPEAKYSISTVLPTTERPTNGTSRVGEKLSIEMFGSSTRVQYSRDTTSTTRTATQQTTTSQIWNACRDPITTESTTHSPNGTRLQNQKNGEFGIVKSAGRTCLTTCDGVLSVTPNLLRDTWCPSEYYDAPIVARILNDIPDLPSLRKYGSVGNVGSITPKEESPHIAQTVAETPNDEPIVDGVVNHLSNGASQQLIAVSHAVVAAITPVYDLEVEDAHEFFANGVLVHNSSAASNSACWTVGTLMSKCPDGNYYVEDVVRGQWEPHVRNKMILATAQRDRARYGPGRNEPLIYVEREGGSAGRDAWKSIARFLAGFHIIEDSVTGSKELRAGPWAAQLAAGNVFLVDNGQNDGSGMRQTWDIQAFIDEHLTFPNGKWLDQVDSADGAFNLLAGQKKMEGILRTISVRNRNKSHTMRIVVTPPELLHNIEIDEPTLLVWFLDYDPNETSGQHAKQLYEGMGNLAQIHESTILRFDDTTIADNQEQYLTPLTDGSTWADRVMLPEHGRQFWSFLLRPRTYGVGAVILVDDKQRAMSCALAFCAQMRFDPKKTIQVPGEVVVDVSKPPNQHVYRIAKFTRGVTR